MDTLALALKGGPQGLTGTRRRLRRREHRTGYRIGDRRRRRSGVEVHARQSRAGGSRRPLQAAHRHRPLGRRARHRDRRRLPLQRRGPEPVRGRDAALAPRRHHAQGVRPDRHAHARRQPRLLADRLHHRRGLPPDSAAAGIHAAGDRRHGRREPHVRRECAAAGPEERHAGHAALPARSRWQRADVDPQPGDRLPRAPRQLSARPAREDRLVHADAGR